MHMATWAGTELSHITYRVKSWSFRMIKTS